MSRITQIILISMLISFAFAAGDQPNQYQTNCTVSFILPSGSVCLTEHLTPNRLIAYTQGITTCNDLISQVDVEGNCQKCWLTMFEDYNFDGQRFTYSLETNKYTDLTEYDFVNAQGKVSNTWDRVVSAYKIKCANTKTAEL